MPLAYCFPCSPSVHGKLCIFSMPACIIYSKQSHCQFQGPSGRKGGSNSSAETTREGLHLSHMILSGMCLSSTCGIWADAKLSGVWISPLYEGAALHLLHPPHWPEPTCYSHNHLFLFHVQIKTHALIWANLAPLDLKLLEYLWKEVFLVRIKSSHFWKIVLTWLSGGAWLLGACFMHLKAL